MHWGRCNPWVLKMTLLRPNLGVCKSYDVLKSILVALFWSSIVCVCVGGGGGEGELMCTLTCCNRSSDASADTKINFCMFKKSFENAFMNHYPFSQVANWFSIFAWLFPRVNWSSKKESKNLKNSHFGHWPMYNIGNEHSVMKEHWL